MILAAWLCLCTTGAQSAKDSLPMPQIRFGMATIRGQLTGDSLPPHIVLFESASYYSYGATMQDTLIAQVAPDGTFSFRLPVVHEQPIALGLGNHRLMMCYAAPDDTTVVRIDLNLMRQPKRQRKEHFTQVVRGPLAALANEYNHTQPINNYWEVRESALESYNNHPDFIGSDPKILLPKVINKHAWIRKTQKLSPALKELLLLNDRLCLIAIYEEEMTYFPDYIHYRGGEAISLYKRRSKQWKQDFSANKIEAFLAMLCSPKQLLCPAFTGVAHQLNSVPTLYPDYVEHEMNALAMRQQLKIDFAQLDQTQIDQNMAALPAPYRAWLHFYQDRLDTIKAENAKLTGYRFCELPKVAEYHDYELFGKLCKRYSGKLVFMHFWNPNYYKSMEQVRDIIKPLQQAMADYDVTWVNLATLSTESRWRALAPQLLGDHYLLSTLYQQSAIEISVVGKPISGSIYIIVDEKGKVVYHNTAPQPVSELEEQLKKYAKKKTE